MNKSLILSILIGGMCGNFSTPTIAPVVAGSLPTKQASRVETPAAKLELISTGAEPRRELKFRPAVNSKQTMTMTMGMSMEMAMGDRPMPKVAVPKMVIKIDLNVLKVDPSGDISYSFVYSDIKAIADKSVSPELVTNIQKGLDSLIGLKGNMVVASSGQVKSKNLILPKNIDPKMKETLGQFNKSLEQLSTRLPSGMIGLGAKWQVNNAIEAGGIKVNQSSNYEIVQLDDRGMTIASKINQSSPPQDLQLPTSAKEMKAKLVSLTSNGAGRYVVRFDSLLPISGQSSVNTDSKMSIQTGVKESPTNVSNKIAIDMNISDR